VVGVLMRTKLRVLRHSFTGTRAAQMVSGATAGVLAAAATVWLVLATGDRAGDTLAIGLASWVIGWVVGPMMSGTDPGIRREHLALLPLTHRQTAVALFGAALVGVGPAVTLVAMLALVCYGVALGGAAAAVGPLAAVLTVLLVVALSNVVVTGIGALLRSRWSAALTAIPWGILTCFAAQGWVVVAAVTGGSDNGLPPAIATALRVIPSGWPLAAVEAAGRGDRLVAAGVLAGLVVLTGAALLVWGRLLRRPATPPVIEPAGGRDWQPATTRAAVVGKELRTWSRDLVRIHFLAFALVYATTYSLLPLLIGSTDYLPLTGVFAVVLAVGASAHLYSSDGTALWQTLMTPGVERAEVRGRQLAWLLTIGPVAALLTAAGVVANGRPDIASWATGLLPVVLGAGAGLVVLVSVYVPIRITDPHRRGSNPGQDGGAIAGLIWLAIGALAVLSAPVLALLGLGQARHDHALMWTASPAGIAIGPLLAWGFGRLAARRLARKGTELLARIGTT
jgi:ABC-2 type transport system permease protein